MTTPIFLPITWVLIGIVLLVILGVVAYETFRNEAERKVP